MTGVHFVELETENIFQIMIVVDRQSNVLGCLGNGPDTECLEAVHSPELFVLLVRVNLVS